MIRMEGIGLGTLPRLSGDRIVTFFGLGDKASALEHFLEVRADLLSKVTPGVDDEHKKRYEEVMPQLFGAVVNDYLEGAGFKVQRTFVYYGKEENALIHVEPQLLVITKDPKIEGYPPLEQLVISPDLWFYAKRNHLEASCMLKPVISGEAGEENFYMLLEAYTYQSLIDRPKIVALDFNRVAPLDNVMVFLNKIGELYHRLGQEKLADLRELKKLSGSSSIKSPDNKSRIKGIYLRELSEAVKETFK